MVRRIRVAHASGRAIVTTRGFIVPILCAIVLAVSFACDGVPDVIGPREPNPPNTEKPSGKIVFVSDQETSPTRQIYVMRSDGSERTRITHDSNDYINPIFSPEGTTILASSYTMDGSDEIYAMNADGSDLRNLSNATGDDNFASYSPDGSKIVFASTRDGNSEIYIMDFDGHHQTRLTDSELIDHAPQFTPDGSRILYCSTDMNALGTDTYDYDIYVMNLVGSNKIRLTEERACHVYPPHAGKEPMSRQLILKPSIASDGSRIVFSSWDSKSRNNQVLLMDADGRNCRVVTAEDFIVAPMFAPGNSRIVFMSHRDHKYDLYEMNLDGTRQTKLTRGTPGHVLFGQFSPDGSTILFATDVSSNVSGSHETIWTMNRDGSVQTQLTFGQGNDTFPRFQPIRK
jgi:Tol biopolymer transport system component